MWSILVLALISLGNADKLNRLYLPPPNANLAGGSPGDILVPKQSSLDENINETPKIFQTTRGPNRILSYSSTTPVYNEFSVPETDQVLIKAIPTNDKITENFRNGNTEENFNQNSLLPNNVRGTDVNYSGKVSLPDAQGDISPNTFLSSFPSDRVTNVGANSYAKPENRLINNNSFEDNEDKTVNLAPLPTNVENVDESLKPSRLSQSYPQGLITDKVRYRFPSSGVSNLNRQYPERVQAEADRQAVILNYENRINPDSYAYSFDTSNGIHGDENGTILDGTRAQGSYSYIGDDGKLYNVTYTADENGFQPRGDHLPTPPPIPEAIQKALEKIAENERNGIFDDGSYNENKYGYKNYGRPGNREPTFYKNQPFGQTSTSLNVKSDYPNTEIGITPYRKLIKPSSESDQDYDSKIDKIDNDEDYDDMNQVIKPVDFESNNDRTAISRLPTKQGIVTRIPSNQGNLPSFRRGQESINPSSQINSFESVSLPIAYPSTISDSRNSDGYSTITPLTETGYQYFVPTNQFIAKPNRPSGFLKNNNDELGTTVPSTLRPFLTEKAPQTYTEYENKRISTQPQIYNNFFSPNVFGDNLVSQKNPQSNGRNNEILNGYKPSDGKTNQGENDSLKPEQAIYQGQTKKPYNINVQDTDEDFNANIPENRQFGQKMFKPSSIYNTNPQYYSTTPMPSQFPFNPQTDNSQFINNPSGKLGFSTTSRPNTITTPERNIGNISPEDEINEFDKTTELFNTPKVTEGPISPGINDSENSGYTRPVTLFNTPSTKFIGEDFSGPKQPQIFDPITGYHY